MYKECIILTKIQTTTKVNDFGKHIIKVGNVTQLTSTCHWQNGLIPNYTFNAKELDEETGMYYYEARYMAPPTFISRDPLFEKYFFMSPYAYCANNPLKYVDPTGMDGELVGSEEDIQTALKYIQNAAPNMKLEIQENVDDIGSKTYKLVMGEGGVAKTKYEKQLEEAINSTDIKFVISLEENNGQAGSYYGTEYDEGSKQYVSTNKVNLIEMRSYENKWDAVCGSGLMHEMTEGFEMGKIAKEKHRNIEAARVGRDENGQIRVMGKDYDQYTKGHQKATPDPKTRKTKPKLFFEL